MGALPRPDLPPGPRRELSDALHDLHHRAGWPTLRRLATEAGCSHTTVSKVFSQPALPSWGTVELLVEAMGGSVAEFHDLWLAASAPATAGPGAPPVRIAGRRAELAAVRRHLATGSGLMLVTGEAGIGKTTLVAAAAAASDAFVATGHCLPLSTEVPLMPVIDVLRAVHDADDGQWLKEALADCPAYVGAALSPLLPELDIEPAAASSDELARQHLFAALGRCLAGLHGLRPLGIVLEDLHWADSATLDLLEHLVAGPTRSPIVGTWRTLDDTVAEASSEWLARVQRGSDRTSCELQPLSLDETEEQLCLGVSTPVQRELAMRIHDRSRGHPLFTEHLAAQGGDGPLPHRLAEVLDRRLEGLGEDAVAVATVLGLADRGLTDTVLTTVTGLEHDVLLDALRQLASRNLLGDDPRTALLSHPLLAEAARRRIVPGQAPTLHRRLAEALSEKPDAHAAEIAEHWRHAGDAERELEWRVEAARQAHDRTAPGAEASQWVRALEIHPTLSGSAFDEGEARLAAFDAFELTGELERAVAVLRPAMQAIEHLDDHRAAEVLRRMAMAEDWLNDDTVLGLSLADRALALLLPHGASEGLVHALDLRANQLMDLGRYEEALQALRQALDTCEALDDDGLFFGASATLAWHVAHVGDLDGALKIIGEARSRVPGSAGPRREAYMAMMHTDALIKHRRPAEEVMAAAARAVEIGHDWDMDFHFLALARANVVEALFKTGRVREAAEVLAGLPTSDRYDHWPVSWMSAQLAIAEGRPADGLATFRGLDVTGTTSENILNRTHWIAVAQLWLGRPEDAWVDLVPTLEAVLGTPTVWDSCETFVVLARAAADVADRNRDRAAELGHALVDVRERAVVDPLGPAPAPITRTAATAQWDAELARIDHHDTVERWSRAVMEWDALQSPHDAGYCLWRAAQSALRQGQGTVAARLLRRAAHDAREHVPLSRAIAATAGRGPTSQ